MIRAIGSLDGIETSNADQATGVSIIKSAIEAPLRVIVENAGGEGSVIVQKVREGEANFGYNAREDRFEDMFEAGIIDPTKVTRLALENAASIASLLLTTEAVVADEPVPDAPAAPAGGMPGMGGGMGGMM